MKLIDFLNEIPGVVVQSCATPDAHVMVITEDGLPYDVVGTKLEKGESFEGTPSDTGQVTLWLDVLEV